MNTIYRFLILAVLIIAALSAYSYGSSTGVFLFVILGFVFEGLFWYGLFSKKSKSKKTVNS
jgi:type IV secretory pathway TrbL component